MKACPACGRLYPDEAGFCPVDGTRLSRATDVPVPAVGGDARIGQLLAGRYQMRRVVADGGMGRVYEALDMIDRRSVALKVLHPEVATDSVALERFRREYEFSRQLPHQHIVEVLAFMPTQDGSYALVMEFLYGEELRATLKREGVIAPERAVRMVSQIALGLDEAHARKLVHRDLKPDNIFLCQTVEGDIVKILDFGSVKDKTDNAKKLTVMGTTIGSPYYMAPEQAQGLDTLDQRADVWALGAIFYECVAGRVPFAGPNGPTILLEILTKEPMLVSLAGRGQQYPVPPTLDRVLLQAFRKSPAERIASVGALADAVGAAYGLQGGHRDWAITSQNELGARIQERLPLLMQTGVRAPAGDVAVNSFFGETGSLEVMGDPFAAPAAAPAAPADPAAGHRPAWAPPAQADAADRPELSELRIPTKSSGCIWLAVLGVLGLVLGIVVALVLTR
jgi:serine/threonine-protein kinase